MHFDQPVQVEPETFYTASVVLDGAELSYFGQEGMPEVTSGAVTFQFQCSAESTNGTGVQGGQIPELLFYGPPPDSAESKQATLKRRADRLKLKQASSASEPQQANSTTPTASSASDNSQL